MRAAQTITIQRILAKKFTDREAAEILDCVEDVAKRQSGGWLKWVVGKLAYYDSLHTRHIQFTLGLKDRHGGMESR